MVWQLTSPASVNHTLFGDRTSFVALLGQFDKTDDGANVHAAAKGATRNFVRLGATYIAQGDNLAPIDTGELSATSISQLKQTLAPITRVKNANDDATPAQENAQ